MKINHIALVTLLCCLIGTTTSFGQAKGFAFGVKGGVNLSKLSMGSVLSTRYDNNGNPYLAYNGREVRDNLQESYDSRTGFSGGVFTRGLASICLFSPRYLFPPKGVPSTSSAMTRTLPPLSRWTYVSVASMYPF